MLYRITVILSLTPQPTYFGSEKEVSLLICLMTLWLATPLLDDIMARDPIA